MLQNFKNVLQLHLRAPPVLDATYCENANTRTAEGIFGRTRSGVCEACWDVLRRDDLAAAAHLIATPGGLRIHWGLDPHAGAQIAVATTIGVLQPPVVWVAGREPPPPPVVPPHPDPAGPLEVLSEPFLVLPSIGLRASLWAAQTVREMFLCPSLRTA